MEEECLFCKCFDYDYSGRKKRNISVAEITVECKDHLLNWEKWLRTRKAINESLAKRLNRPKDHLLMNSFEEKRKVVEEMILFENKRNWLHCDKLRGHPQWFKLPPRFYQCNKDVPIYEATLTKEQKKEMVPIEYVTTPNYVLTEKHIMPRTRNMFEQWRKGVYRQAVMRKITKKMKFLEPYRPQTSEIIVVGNKIELKQPVAELNSTRCTGPCKTSDICKTNVCDQPISKTVPKSYPGEEHKKEMNTEDVPFSVTQIPLASIRINGNQITPAILEQSCMKIRVLFTSDEIPEKPMEKFIVFENKGRTALRISFCKFQKYITFRDIVPDVRKISPFYFNKNELILIPAREIRLPIWFKPQNTGHFIETWKVITRPELSSGFNITVILQGIAYKEDYFEKSSLIKKNLENRIRYTLVKEIIDDIMETTKYEQSHAHTYTFAENDIFESMNIEKWGAVTRRKYLYNKEIVHKLTKLYYNVKTPEDPPHWNYSIKTLKEATRKRDILDFVKKLHNECTRINERAQVLKEMYDTPLNGLQETSRLKFLTAQEMRNDIGSGDNMHKTSDHQLSFTGYEKLNILLQKLERPAMIINTERKKNAMVFFILRFYLTKISKDLENYNEGFVKSLLEVNYNIDDIHCLPERLIFERFDCIWVKRTRRIQVKSQTAQSSYPVRPKLKILEEIPSTDFEALHTAYFNRKPSVDKKKREIKKDNTKSKASMARNSKILETPSEDDVNELFDPYADIADYLPAISTTTHPKKVQADIMHKIPTTSTTSIPFSSKTYEEKYLIVYTNLCSAVDAMVNALETMVEIKVPIPSLGELASCKVISTESSYRRISSVQSMDQFDPSFDEYYQYLVDTYLKDRRTQDYFLKEKTVPIVEKLTEYYKKSFSDLSVKSWKSQQYLVEDIPVANQKEVGVQTSETEEFIKPISNILIRGDILSHSMINERDSNMDMEDNKSSEVFHFVESSENIRDTEVGDKDNSNIIHAKDTSSTTYAKENNTGNIYNNYEELW